MEGDVVVRNPEWSELEQQFPDHWPADQDYQLWSLYDQRLFDGRNTLASAGIMPVGGEYWSDESGNTGHTARPRRTESERPRSQLEAPVADFLQEGGWSRVRPKAAGSGHNGGLVGHVGVLQPGEYVDRFELRRQACALLGFAYAQVRSVYGTGRLAKDRRQLRAEVDREVLRLASEGGNMWQLAAALLVDRNTIRRAIKRAKNAGGAA
jgi:hypothetical protein